MFVTYLMEELSRVTGTGGKRGTCYAISKFLTEKYPQYSWPVHQLKQYERGTLVPGPNKGIAMIEAIEWITPIPYCISLTTDAVINSKKVSDYAVMQHIVVEQLMYKFMNTEPPVDRAEIIEAFPPDVLPP